MKKFAFFAGVLISAFSLVALGLSSPTSRVFSKTVSITTTEEMLTADFGRSDTYKSCRVWNNSATPLYVGGSDVDSTDGYPICTDTAACPEAKLTVDGHGIWAVSGSGTLTPRVVCVE